MFEWQMRRLENAGKRLDVILQHPEKFYDVLQLQTAQDEYDSRVIQQIVNNPGLLNNPGMLSIGY